MTLISKRECFKIVLKKISELGYSVCWSALNSASFGIPQFRRRLFIVGYLGERCPAEILSFRRGNAEIGKERKTEQLIGGPQGSRGYSTSGTAVAQCSGSGGRGGRTGLYLVDYNEDPKITETARCITERQNSGMSYHKGKHSAVFVDMNESTQITDNWRRHRLDR